MPVSIAPTFLTIEVVGFLKKKRGKDVLRAIERGMLAGAVAAIPRIKAFTPVWNGFLKQGWQINFRKRPRRVLIVNTNAPGKVGAMEDGRRGQAEGAKAPPFAAILAWATMKIRGGPKEIRKIAGAIWFRIWKFGIEVPLKISGKGAMVARTVEQMGARFFGQKVIDEVNKLR